MEFIDSSCNTAGCAARAAFVIKNLYGAVVGAHCRRHAPDALKAQNATEKSQPNLKEVVTR